MDTYPKGERDVEEHPENEDGFSEVHPYIHTGLMESLYFQDPLLFTSDDTSLSGVSGERTEHH